MPKLTPQEAAAKLSNRIGQSGAAYLKGVQNTDKDPIALAIAAAPKWEAGIQDAIANGRYVKGLQRTNKTAWQNAVRDFGQSNYQSSGAKAERNYEKFATRFFPHLETVQQEVEAMPNLSFQDSLNRMIHNATRLRDFRNSS